MQRGYNQREVGRVTAEGEVKAGTAVVNCEALTKMWKGVGEEKLKKKKERGRREEL